MNKLCFYLVFLLVRVAVAQTPKDFWTCPIDTSKGLQMELDLNLEQMKYTANRTSFDFRQKSKSKNQRIFYVIQLTEDTPPAYEAVFERTSKKISLYEYFKGGPKKLLHQNIQCQKNN